MFVDIVASTLAVLRICVRVLRDVTVLTPLRSVGGGGIGPRSSAFQAELWPTRFVFWLVKLGPDERVASRRMCCPEQQCLASPIRSNGLSRLAR
jgi:hypothetical protein